ncbi:hypothetical protein MAPG_12077 [Magnaporthiopsis poae ATCC 64411]|uniref:Uncharacterized protein n=1 Tax=Magnaporthiopsis poae (strain ATCC 64411 / 73-15) TaxID=644358 RepID=A0A0C4EGS7_MAGP6|nr:hypothetical protein MAPG_12077 [Magnaporthiopsis poae ATCC 64411]
MDWVGPDGVVGLPSTPAFLLLLLPLHLAQVTPYAVVAPYPSWPTSHLAAHSAPRPEDRCSFPFLPSIFGAVRLVGRPNACGLNTCMDGTHPVDSSRKRESWKNPWFTVRNPIPSFHAGRIDPTTTAVPQESRALDTRLDPFSNNHFEEETGRKRPGGFSTLEPSWQPATGSGETAGWSSRGVSGTAPLCHRTSPGAPSTPPVRDRGAATAANTTPPTSTRGAAPPPIPAPAAPAPPNCPQALVQALVRV